jgi:hypothetical protein
VIAVKETTTRQKREENKFGEYALKLIAAKSDPGSKITIF